VARKFALVSGSPDFGFPRDDRLLMKKCPYCGRGDNADDAATCSECGTDLHPRKTTIFQNLNIKAWLANLSRSLAMWQKVSILALVLTFASLAAYVASFYLHHAKMSETQVIAIASDAAVTNGFFLNEFDSPHAKFEPWKHNRTWVVTFGLKMVTPWEPPLPPRHSAHGAPSQFFAIVSDQTGKVVFGLPGATISGPTPVPLPPGFKFWPISNKGNSGVNTN
jgi:hypothetical protein